MKTGIVWFKNDLRVQDNASLHLAIKQNDRVIGAYFFDPRLFEKDKFGFKKTEKYRAKFMIETVKELQQNLHNLNITLLTFQQKPEAAFLKLVADYKLTSIYLQKEWTAEEIAIINMVKESLKNSNINFTETYDQFLFHPSDLPFSLANTSNVFTAFRKKCERYCDIRKILPLEKQPTENLIKNKTKLPKLGDLDFENFETDNRTAFPWQGGETQALKRLQHYFWKSKKLSYYKKTRNGLVGEDYSSKFSAWLANGSISAKTIYYEVMKYEETVAKNQSTYWLIFELIWRDFFKYISLKHGNNIFKLGGILNKNYKWREDERLVEQWINGQTNEPFVNANMIELKQTGWMSNRGRQNVASFFAKEQNLDWRIGAAYFESILIDYDVHSNYGNWLYVAGVGNDPRDRKFNIQLQAKRYDANKKFQNLWLQKTLF